MSFSLQYRLLFPVRILSDYNTLLFYALGIICKSWYIKATYEARSTYLESLLVEIYHGLGTKKSARFIIPQNKKHI